jgi:hypothetical protein
MNKNNKKKNNTKKKHHKCCKGGYWAKVIETAVVPFALLGMRNSFKKKQRKKIKTNV